MAWPRWHGLDWAATDSSSSLQATGSPPRRPHDLPAPRVSVLPPAFTSMFTPLLMLAWQGLCRHGDTMTPPPPNARLYEWPIAAVTNPHQLGGVSDPHLCLPFWRSRGQHGPAELRARCRGAAFLPRLRGDWSLPLPAPGGRPHSFLHRHSR